MSHNLLLCDLDHCSDALRPFQVASLTVGPDYNSHFESLFKFFMGQLQLVLPPGGCRSAHVDHLLRSRVSPSWGVQCALNALVP
jgi:hypothetical protein